MTGGASGADRTSADPIERTHLDRLATRFGSHFLIQLIDLFITQGKDRMMMAQRAANERDAGAIVMAAHALKSSAGNLGAGALGQIASEIERRGSAGASADTLAPLVTRLNEAFTAACEALETHRLRVARRTPET